MADDTKIVYRLAEGSESQRWLLDRFGRLHLTGESVHHYARHELAAWQETLAAELARLPQFTVTELRCVAAALADWSSQGYARPAGARLGLAYQAVYDASKRDGCKPGTAWSNRWRIDMYRLLEGKLAPLGPAADAALRDAISRWQAQGTVDGPAGGFDAVGLRAAPVGPQCTGPDAPWCPVHGICTCTGWDACPLHEAGSTHADPAADPTSKGAR